MDGFGEFQKYLQQENLKYEKQLRAWLLNNIMPRITSDKALIGKILTDKESMRIMRMCFTHESYDASENYERLEVVGDKILGMAASEFFYDKFPEATSSGISSLVSQYSSNEIQVKMMKITGADEIIRVSSSAAQDRDKILGDVFESMFAGIYKVFKLHRSKVAYTAAENLFITFYEKDVEAYKIFEYDDEIQNGSYKTQVVQMFNRFFIDEKKYGIRTTSDGKVKLREPKEEVVNIDDNSITIKVSLLMVHLMFLTTNGLNAKNLGDKLKKAGELDGVSYEVNIEKDGFRKYIGIRDQRSRSNVFKAYNRMKPELTITGTGETKNIVKSVLYKLIFDELKSIGFTPEKAKTLKFRDDIAEPGMASLYKKAQIRLKDLGLQDSIRFDTSTKMSTVNRKIHLLTGFKKDGTPIRLMAASAPKNDAIGAKREMLRAFGNGDKLTMIDLTVDRKEKGDSVEDDEEKVISKIVRQKIIDKMKAEEIEEDDSESESGESESESSESESSESESGESSESESGESSESESSESESEDE